MVVNPNTTAEMTAAVVAAARRAARPDTLVVGGTAASGVDSVESNADEVWGAAGVLDQVAAGPAVDAFVIACFGDTGVAAARELATVPVVGMTEAALLTAALLGARTAVITLPRRTREMSLRVVRALGQEHRCSVRAVDVPVAQVAGGSRHLLDLFVAEGRSALDDGAEVLVLGCAGLADLVEPLQDALGVPVVEGVAAAVTMAEGLLAQGLSTSRACTYAPPPRRGPR
ncbi:MAG: allantoin racemase [Blastococcus sp.]|jgi:allantoin racemase|nr:allantoin racemase [Blastococcus sp.]